MCWICVVLSTSCFANSTSCFANSTKRPNPFVSLPIKKTQSSVDSNGYFHKGRTTSFAELWLFDARLFNQKIMSLRCVNMPSRPEEANSALATHNASLGSHGHVLANDMASLASHGSWLRNACSRLASPT